MSLIYEPNGRAREYAELACNVYTGCDHACVYCYAPSATFKDRNDFIASKPRKDFITKLEKEASGLWAQGKGGQVLLSFTCDPYQALDVSEQTTRQTIEVLHRYGFKVCTLTKGGSRAMRDLDLFGTGDAFATTLTFTGDDNRWQEWEQAAASPIDRIETIQRFHSAGIPTWVSLEPTIDPAESLEIIRRTHYFVDLFKVGKLNYHKHANTVDWRSFGNQAITLLDSLGYRREMNHDAVQMASRDNQMYYVKHDLAQLL